MAAVSGLVGDLTGQVIDLTYEPAAGAAVELLARQGFVAAGHRRDGQRRLGFGCPARLSRNSATRGCGSSFAAVRRRSRTRLPAADLRFQPVRYRPIPEQVDRAGRPASVPGRHLEDRPAPAEGRRTGRSMRPCGRTSRFPASGGSRASTSRKSKRWRSPPSLRCPQEWSDRRVFLRFDAIHAGTDYWLNGQPLGTSENLFTPVEWEITSQVRPGAANRLDLEMKVDTPSERLSYSSGYAFHSLGGIDRRVSALCPAAVHVSCAAHQRAT